MSSEFENEIENYRSIVQENGAISALIKLVEDSSTKSEKIRNRVLDPSITENVSEEINCKNFLKMFRYFFLPFIDD